MTTFQTNRTNIKGYILKQVLACIAIFIILGIYEYYISTKPSNWIFYLTMACLTIIQLIVELFKKRLFTIAFDLQKKQIFFLYKNFFYREKIKKFLLRQLKLKLMMIHRFLDGSKNQ
jgi:hypothetical protein